MKSVVPPTMRSETERLSRSFSLLVVPDQQDCGSSRQPDEGDQPGYGTQGGLAPGDEHRQHAPGECHRQGREHEKSQPPAIERGLQQHEDPDQSRNDHCD